MKLQNDHTSAQTSCILITELYMYHLKLTCKKCSSTMQIIHNKVWRMWSGENDKNMEVNCHAGQRTQMWQLFGMLLYLAVVIFTHRHYSSQIKL